MPPATLCITLRASRPVRLIPAKKRPLTNSGVPGYQVVGLQGCTFLPHGLQLRLLLVPFFCLCLGGFGIFNGGP